MRASQAGLGERDLRTGYGGFGFVCREGAHVVFTHPDYPDVAPAVVGRSRALPQSATQPLHRRGRTDTAPFDNPQAPATHASPIQLKRWPVADGCRLSERKMLGVERKLCFGRRETEQNVRATRETSTICRFSADGRWA